MSKQGEQVVSTTVRARATHPPPVTTASSAPAGTTIANGTTQKKRASPPHNVLYFQTSSSDVLFKQTGGRDIAFRFDPSSSAASSEYRGLEQRSQIARETLLDGRGRGGPRSSSTTPLNLKKPNGTPGGLKTVRSASVGPNLETIRREHQHLQATQFIPAAAHPGTQMYQVYQTNPNNFDVKQAMNTSARSSIFSSHGPRRSKSEGPPVERSTFDWQKWKSEQGYADTPYDSPPPSRYDLPRTPPDAWSKGKEAMEMQRKALEAEQREKGNPPVQLPASRSTSSAGDGNSTIGEDNTSAALLHDRHVTPNDYRTSSYNSLFSSFKNGIGGGNGKNGNNNGIKNANAPAGGPSFPPPGEGNNNANAYHMDMNDRGNPEHAQDMLNVNHENANQNANSMHSKRRAEGSTMRREMQSQSSQDMYQLYYGSPRNKNNMDFQNYPTSPRGGGRGSNTSYHGNNYNKQNQKRSFSTSVTDIHCFGIVGAYLAMFCTAIMVGSHVIWASISAFWNALVAEAMHCCRARSVAEMRWCVGFRTLLVERQPMSWRRRLANGGDEKNGCAVLDSQGGQRTHLLLKGNYNKGSLYAVPSRAATSPNASPSVVVPRALSPVPATAELPRLVEGTHQAVVVPSSKSPARATMANANAMNAKNQIQGQGNEKQHGGFVEFQQSHGHHVSSNDPSAGFNYAGTGYKNQHDDINMRMNNTHTHDPEDPFRARQDHQYHVKYDGIVHQSKQGKQGQRYKDQDDADAISNSSETLCSYGRQFAAFCDRVRQRAFIVFYRLCFHTGFDAFTVFVLLLNMAEILAEYDWPVDAVPKAAHITFRSLDLAFFVYYNLEFIARSTLAFTVVKLAVRDESDVKNENGQEMGNINVDEQGTYINIDEQGGQANNKKQGEDRPGREDEETVRLRVWPYDVLISDFVYARKGNIYMLHDLDHDAPAYSNEEDDMENENKTTMNVENTSTGENKAAYTEERVLYFGFSLFFDLCLLLLAYCTEIIIPAVVCKRADIFGGSSYDELLELQTGQQGRLEDTVKASMLRNAVGLFTIFRALRGLRLLRLFSLSDSLLAATRKAAHAMFLLRPWALLLGTVLIASVFISLEAIGRNETLTSATATALAQDLEDEGEARPYSEAIAAFGRSSTALAVFLRLATLSSGGNGGPFYDVQALAEQEVWMLIWFQGVAGVMVFLILNCIADFVVRYAEFTKRIDEDLSAYNQGGASAHVENSMLTLVPTNYDFLESTRGENQLHGSPLADHQHHAQHQLMSSTGGGLKEDAILLQQRTGSTLMNSRNSFYNSLNNQGNSMQQRNDMMNRNYNTTQFLTFESRSFMLAQELREVMAAVCEDPDHWQKLEKHLQQRKEVATTSTHLQEQSKLRQEQDAEKTTDAENHGAPSNLPLHAKSVSRLSFERQWRNSACLRELLLDALKLHDIEDDRLFELFRADAGGYTSSLSGGAAGSSATSSTRMLLGSSLFNEAKAVISAAAGLPSEVVSAETFLARYMALRFLAFFDVQGYAVLSVLCGDDAEARFKLLKQGFKGSTNAMNA